MEYGNLLNIHRFIEPVVLAVSCIFTQPIFIILLVLNPFATAMVKSIDPFPSSSFFLSPKILLGGGEHVCPCCQCWVPLRIRVPRKHWTTGHHAVDRSMLPYPDRCSSSEVWGCPSRTRRDGKDWNYKGVYRFVTSELVCMSWNWLCRKMVDFCMNL